MDAGVHRLSRGVNAEIDAAERPALLEPLDDGDAVDAVRDAVVGVPGGDHVDQAWPQRPCKLEDLALWAAGRQVVRVGEHVAAAASVREHDDDRRSSLTQARRFAFHDVLQRYHLEPHEVARIGARRCRDARDAKETDAYASDRHDGRWLHVGRCPRRSRFRDQVGGQEGERRLAGALLDVAGRIVVRRARYRVRTGRPEIELVVADGDGVVVEGVVRAHPGSAFAQVRLERALPHVAGIEQQHAAAIRAPRRTHVLHVSGQPRHTLDMTVYVRGRDDGDGEGAPCRSGRRLRRRDRPRAGHRKGHDEHGRPAVHRQTLTDERIASPRQVARYQRRRPSSLSPSGVSVATWACVRSQSRGSPGNAGRCG